MQKFLTMFNSLDSWPTIAIIHWIPLLILNEFWTFRLELDKQLQSELDRAFCKMSMFTKTLLKWLTSQTLSCINRCLHQLTNILSKGLSEKYTYIVNYGMKHSLWIVDWNYLKIISWIVGRGCWLRNHLSTTDHWAANEGCNPKRPPGGGGDLES